MIVDNIWYKIITTVLIFYVFIAGLARPLNPGILDTQPLELKAGSNINVQASTYNTSSTPDHLMAWLKVGDDYILPSIKIQKEKLGSLDIQFSLPQFLPNETRIVDASLIIYDDHDGAYVRPTAFVITQDSINVSEGIKSWTNPKSEFMHVHKGSGFPFRSILEETIRNIFYHVPLWFAMVILYSLGVFYGIRYLVKKNEQDSIKVFALNSVGFYFGIFGLITGAIWAKSTWGSYWTTDIKLNMTAISMLIYAAYFILYRSFSDRILQNRVSTVYSIFAFGMLVPLIFVIPRLYSSLHPGNGGNPALGGEDLDNTMRTVFYPAVIGFTMLGVWIARLKYRILNLIALAKQ